MVQLVDLTPELLLCIAAHLRQTDLLNVSLTSHRLRAITEPELYREYINPRLYGRSFVPFLLRLIERPVLVKYVHRLELKGWITLNKFDPEMGDGTGEQFDAYQPPQPSEAEYQLLAQAAKQAGVVASIFPYERHSVVAVRARAIAVGYIEFDEDSAWYEYIFDPEISIADIPYDQKFCQLLRAGIQDAHVVLLVALLPNVREMYLHGAPHDLNTLPWRAPLHNFHALRRFGACATDFELEWPAAFFNNMLQIGKLETFETYKPFDSWLTHNGSGERCIKVHFALRPGCLNLKRLVMQQSLMEYAEMKVFLGACRYLKSVYCSTIDDNFGPAKFVGLLQPFVETLEELYLDILPNWDDEENNRLNTLANFTRLKRLDTAPNMWSNVLTEDIEDVEHIEEVEDMQFPEYAQFHERLPPNVMHLIFHQGGGSSDLSIHQVRNLLQIRLKRMPCLETLVFETRDAEYKGMVIDQLRVQTLLDKESDDASAVPSTFCLKVILVKENKPITRTIFDIIPHNSILDLTKWTGKRYAQVTTKTPAILKAIEPHLQEPPENTMFTGLDISALARSPIIMYAVSEHDEDEIAIEQEYDDSGDDFDNEHIWGNISD
jgi:hypothetical protein